MKKWMLLMAAVAIGAGCDGADETKSLTKAQARSMGGVDDNGADLCDRYDWYDDGVCDDFCPNADADCAENNGTNNGSNNASNNGTTGSNNGTTGSNNGTNNGTTGTNNGTNNTTGGECGGFAGLACAADEWCDYPDDSFCGAADQLGACEPRPETCDTQYAPVCGCDGQDYSNACVANAAGVDVAKNAACDAECGADSDCAAGEACVDGVCVAGTDTCGGRTGRACGVGEFCNYALADMCGAADAPGTCAPIPQACPDVYLPVCGCDNNTYGNECEANAAGVAIMAREECKAACRADGDCAQGEACIAGQCERLGGGRCGGLAGLQCNADEWCDFPDDTICGAADFFGDCKPRPQACITLYDPICGCDGQTHSNACFANAAGVDVMASGPCQF